MANEANSKLQVVSIGKLGEYDTLIKDWMETTGSTMIENMSINAIVSSTEPADQDENDIWLQEYV